MSEATPNPSGNEVVSVIGRADTPCPDSIGTWRSNGILSLSQATAAAASRKSIEKREFGLVLGPLGVQSCFSD